MIDPDRELVLDIQNKGCEDSIKQLISKHSPLCYKILQRFYPSLAKVGYTKDDVFNERHYLIYKSAMTFNSSKKTKYSTWLGNYTRYHCLNMLNSVKQQTISIEDESVKASLLKEETTDSPRDENTKEFICHILDELSDPRIKQIYMMRYFTKDGSKKTWKQIAKELNISSPTAINIHNKAKSILKNKVKSKNTLDFI